jgi:uncharacterized lipoprotein
MEDVMRKILILALATMLFAACSKPEETAPPAAEASAEASPAAEASPMAPAEMASPAASPSS